jgi:hypothetical protein
MAEAMPGGMPAPTMEDFAAFEQIRQEVSPSEINETLLSAAAEADPMAVAEFKAELRDLDLPPEVLDALDGMVDEILATPERYAEIRAHYLTQDMSEELLPEAFDPEFFGALSIALDEIRATSGEPARAPQGFAHGGIASLGRNGDTMLAHVTPEEMRMLKDRGGAGTINPRTGLPEFFSLKKIFSKIGRAVKKFARSTIGKIIIGTALFMFAGPMAAQFMGLQAGGMAATAVSGFVAGTGSSLAAGESLKDSLKAGAIGGITAGALQGASNTFGSGTDLTGATQRAAKTAAEEASKQAATSLAPNSVSLTGPAAAPGTTGQITGLPGAGTTVTDPNAVLRMPQSAAAPVTDPNALLRTPQSIPANQGFAAPGPITAAGPSSTTFVPRPVATVPGTVNQAALNAGPGFSLSTGTPIPSGPVPGIAGLTGSSTGPVPGASFAQNIKGALTPGKQDGIGFAQGLKGAGRQAYDFISPSARKAAGADNLVSQYGPLAATGLGVMGLAGGFGSESPGIPEGYGGMMDDPAQALIDANPELYRLRFGGVRPISGTTYQTYAPPPVYTAAHGSDSRGVASQHFPEMDGPINGPGTGTSDDVPAMLSDGEFVFTAKAVRNMGDGSRRKGAKKMYALMKKLEAR